MSIPDIVKLNIADFDAAELDLIKQDTHNRAQALHLNNFIVEAPAGAGKTELLTQRYLKLLATVESPEEIVALTFTNKAAAEMRNRILQSLESAQNNTPTVLELSQTPHKQTTRNLANAALQHAHQKGWQILAQPARLRLLTIDALCSQLARQMPLLSRFGGQPKISDDAAKHYLAAAQQTLAHIQHEENIQQTVSIALAFMHNQIEKLTELLADMLSKRDQWLGLANAQSVMSVEALNKQVSDALNMMIEKRLVDLRQTITIEQQTQWMPIVRFAASNVDENNDLKALQDWQTPFSYSKIDLNNWQILVTFLLNTDNTIRKSLNKNIGFPAKKDNPQSDDFKQQFNELAANIAPIEALIAVKNCPALNQASLTKNSEIVLAIAQLLKLATAELWASFQSSNEVDFVQIAQSASYALQNEDGSTDLALKLDYKISHLLIDEFQDTSPTQMHLIEQLIQGWQINDGRTLFCVGDPMQSIYRFRKADVSLFLAANEYGIGQLPLISLKLTRNNRSHPAVVSWINHTFKTVFPQQDDKTQAAISYRPFIATKPHCDDEGVQTHALVVNNDEESAAAKLIEARYVANLIKLEQQKLPKQTIAVLVRSRNHLRDLVSVIRREYPAIHFQAVEIEGLNDRQTVLDAYSLCRALLHRADRVHWLNVLRAPWCGLILADLHALASNSQGQNIWQLMQDNDRLQSMTIDGQQRLTHVKQVLQQAFTALGRMPLRRLCESTWLALGGGNTLISAGDNRDVQTFFDLVEKLARGLSLDFNQLDLAMLHLYAEPDVQANVHLQFLTIHKSKGLEFDCVILPALNRPPRPPDPLLMLWEAVSVNNQYALLAAPYSKKTQANNNGLYDFLKALETERTDNETTRLLYVAATRAVRKLHLVGTAKMKKDAQLNPQSKSLLALLWPHVKDIFSQANVITVTEIIQQSLAEFSPKLMRLAKPQVPSLLSIIQPELLSLFANNALTKPSEATHLTKPNIHQDAGTLAHLYMELIANAGVTAWPAERIENCALSMRLWLLQRDHAKQDVNKQVAHVINAIIRTTNSPQGAWLLMPRASLKTELALSNRDVTRFNQHRIDLTFIDEAPNKFNLTQKTRWIIDYKLTSLAENNDLKAAAQLHRPQLARYAALFKDEGLPIKMAVLFLSAGEIIEL